MHVSCSIVRELDELVQLFDVSPEEGPIFGIGEHSAVESEVIATIIAGAAIAKEVWKTKFAIGADATNCLTCWEFTQEFCALLFCFFEQVIDAEG